MSAMALPPLELWGPLLKLVSSFTAGTTCLILRFTLSPCPAPAPSGPPLSVVPTAVDPNTIRVTWDPPACDTWNSDAITNYFIKNNRQNPLQVGGDVRTFPISNLPTFAMYTVVMRAANSEGLGPFSVPRTVTLVDGRLLLKAQILLDYQ